MNEQNYKMTRRHLLRLLGLGAAAIGTARVAGNHGIPLVKTGVMAFQEPAENMPGPAKVSVVKGNDCRDNTYQSLMKLEDEIMASLEGKKRILLKPNFVQTSTPLCATNADSVRGILDFLKPRWKGPIVIGESTASRDGTGAGFKNYGYLPLEKEYGVTLTDLNEGSAVTWYAIGQGNAPVPVRILSTFYDKDQYLISAAKMKTHDRVLVTLSLKNILIGAPQNKYGERNYKSSMHQTGRVRSKDTILHYNMFSLAREIFPDLGVIDGFEAMEGNGPVGGTPVDMRVSMASLDSLALDTFAASSMGFDPTQILYLSSMNEAGMGQGNMDQIQVLGPALEDIQKSFQPSTRLIEPYGLGPTAYTEH
jgi:uncharacterized protein (DUF362 family)